MKLFFYCLALANFPSLIISFSLTYGLGKKLFAIFYLTVNLSGGVFLWAMFSCLLSVGWGGG